MEPMRSPKAHIPSSTIPTASSNSSILDETIAKGRELLASGQKLTGAYRENFTLLDEVYQKGVELRNGNDENQNDHHRS